MFTAPITACFGVAFPFLHFYLYRAHHGVVATLLLGVSATALAVGVALAPALWGDLWTRVVFVAEALPAAWPFPAGGGIGFTQHMKEVERSFWSVPLRAAREVALSDPATLPTDVVDAHVLPFLSAAMLGLRGMTPEAYAELSAHA